MSPPQAALAGPPVAPADPGYSTEATDSEKGLSPGLRSHWLRSLVTVLNTSTDHDLTVLAHIGHTDEEMSRSFGDITLGIIVNLKSSPLRAT